MNLVTNATLCASMCVHVWNMHTHKYQYSLVKAISGQNVGIYRSLPKKGPWAEHLTSLPKRGVGALSTVSAFNHERVPTSCLQLLKALEANKITYNGITSSFEVES